MRDPTRNPMRGSPRLLRLDERVPALLRGLQHAAADLVFLDRFEQGLEVALPEAFVPFSLDELEEDRADRGLAEALQQNLGEAALHHALAVDQDAVPLKPGHVLAVARQAAVDPLV